MFRSRRRRLIRDDAPGAMAGQLLGLSLFVMLLAFFIVLNSISTYDKSKIEPMRLSLEQSFATRIALIDNLHPSLTRSDVMDIGEGQMLEQVGALFRAHLAGSEQISTAKGTMYIRMDRAAFEAMIGAIDGKRTKAAQNFLSTLVSVLRAEERGTPYRVDIVYNLEDNPARIAAKEPEKMAAAIRNAASIAEKIEAAGLPQKLMTIGLQQGEAETVELMFSPHTPFDPSGAGDGR